VTFFIFEEEDVSFEKWFLRWLAVRVLVVGDIYEKILPPSIVTAEIAVSKRDAKFSGNGYRVSDEK